MIQLKSLLVRGLGCTPTFIAASIVGISVVSSTVGCDSGADGGASTGGAVTSAGGRSGSGGSAASSGGKASGGVASAGSVSMGGAVNGGASGAGGTLSLGGSAGSSASGGSNAGSSGNSGSAGTIGTGGIANAGGAGGASAGSTGGAVGGMTGGTASSGPLFSDDFEAGALNSKWIPRINGGGMFSLDKSQKHGGTQSLHVVPNSGYSTLLAIEDSSIFPAPNNTFYGRVWLRVPTLPANAHVIWIEAGDVTNDTHEVRVGMNLGYLQTNLYFNGEVDLRDPSATLMAATWECIEFKMGNDDLEVWLNGTKAAGVSTTDWSKVGDGANGGGQPRSNWSPTYKAFRIGWELNAGAEIWFDDVALSYSPIGCQ